MRVLIFKFQILSFHDSGKDKSWFYSYASVFHNGAFFIFGGFPYTDQIGRFDIVSQEWFSAGRLKSSIRYDHGVIYRAPTFVVVGGGGTVKNEVCLLDGEELNCTEPEATDKFAANSHHTRPALFLTESNYGENC